ncbi:V-type ATP synthase subunit I [Spirochaetia bacterium]|nr:V-type ATP synthase subunit I [Spirochaetia bacterium]
MIVPMKKISLVVRDRNQVEALSKLREIGVVHLEKKNVASDALNKAIERKALGESALALIQPYKTPKKKKPRPTAEVPGSVRDRRKPAGARRGRRAEDFANEELEFYSLDAVNAPVRPELIDLMVNMGKGRKAIQDRLIFLARERTRIEAWGEFNPAAIQDLAGSGVSLFPYELTPEAFTAIPPDTRYIRMGKSKAAVYLVVLDKEIPGIASFPLPEKSLGEINQEEAEQKVKLAEAEARIKSFADRRPVLQREMVEIQAKIEFETARAALEKVEDIPPELSFSYLSGFAPAENVPQLKQAAAENGWALIADDPGLEEEVPTKLKNNKLVSLLYPLTDFLEVVPGYRETDITGWFLLFFCLFFGMIFGDAGYGCILFLIAFIGICKTAKTGVPAFFKMLALLSITNTLWGVFTCSWFGVDADKLPQFLKDLSLSVISTAKGASQAEVDRNLQVFCFSIALVQLTIARIMGMARTLREKTLKFFAEFGTLAMLWGMYRVVLFLVVGLTENFILPGTINEMQIAIYLLAGGFGLSFIFASYEGSIIQSVLSSFKNIISVVLGITNVFSDIMSYIRLWAVGLAGASIAITVNSMAGGMLGSFLVFLGLILLVFGHGLNIILNVLSVIVHGVRLNTLEFSGHVGLTWSGFAYKPFAETAKK